jgi:hypothetical protein
MAQLAAEGTGTTPSSKMTITQAVQSVMNGLEVPPIAKCSDQSSKAWVLRSLADKHLIQFKVDKEMAKCFSEGRYGKDSGGLQLDHILLVPRNQRMCASVALPSELHVPLGGGFNMVMGLQEGKPEAKGTPKVYPIVGLQDLARRVLALSMALAALYPQAEGATPLIRRACHTDSGDLLPGSLAAVARALEAAVLELGSDYPGYAHFLQTSIEEGIDRYMAEVATTAVSIFEAPSLASLALVPLNRHFDQLLKDVSQPALLNYMARHFAAPSVQPKPAPTLVKKTVGSGTATTPAPAPAPGPAPAVTPTGAGLRPGATPVGFAATHMPTDAAHPTNAPFCFKHLRSPGSCKAETCKFSHNSMPHNAFSNTAVMSLLGLN